MAHGVGDMLSASNTTVKIVNQQQPNQSNNINNSSHQQHQQRKPVGVMGSRRIFAAAFKLKVLDSYRNDIDCRGNQRATARKYGIHRRQIQKWLQCEDNLRSSCAENGVIVNNNNTTVNATPVNIIGGNTSNNKSTEPTITSCITSTISSPTPATTQAPALNLSLARLHGDDLVGRQGPPPPPQASRHPVHPPVESSTLNQSYQQGINPVSVHTLLIGYTEFTNPDSQHNIHNHNHSQHLSNHQHHQEDTAERKYYTLNHSGYDQVTGYHVANDTRVYEQPQPLTYQSTTGYNGIVNDCQLVGTGLHQTGHVPLCRNSSGNSSPSVKNERASPDSPATPGSCIEAPSSPDNDSITITTTSGLGKAVTISTSQPYHHNSTNRSSAVHIEPHVHTSLDKHPYTVLDSKDSSHEEYSSEIIHQSINDNNNTVKQEIKEEPELSLPEEEVTEGRGESKRSEGKECSDYQCSERSITSISLSPRGTSSSSGQSTTSCSDSETDALDYSTAILSNVIGDLSRRRSFSLRFKLDVLDAFHRDISVAGNQRATARKFGINRRQVQKWLGQESELRGEIALRGGDMRQRLGPLQEIAISESPVDLTTANLDYDQSSALSPIYFCDSSTSRLGSCYTSIGSDITDISQSRSCNLSCCTDNSSITNSPINLQTCYPDSQPNYYCYSERDSIDIVHDRCDLSSLKRSYCTMNCCYGTSPSSKRIYIDDEPQEMPLCLVIPKQIKVPIQSEPVTSTVPTPPAVAPPVPPPKKDPILFKPYLDNPISKPTGDSSTLNIHGVNNNINKRNKNYCHNLCNFNERTESHQNYSVELSLKLPVSWQTHHHHHHHHVNGGFTEFNDGIPSAFDRYPASPHYI